MAHWVSQQKTARTKLVCEAAIEWGAVKAHRNNAHREAVSNRLAQREGDGDSAGDGGKDEAMKQRDREKWLYIRTKQNLTTEDTEKHRGI